MERRVHPLLGIAAGLVFLFLIAPLIIVLGAAFNDATYLAFPPQTLSLRWFERVLSLQNFMDSFLVSLTVALSATGIALLVGIPTSYAIVRHRGSFPGWFSSVFFLPLLVPEIVFGFSLLKTVIVALELPVITALIAGHTILVLPYAVRVLGASLSNFDFSAEEAAVSLGMHPLKAVVAVVLPNIKAGILAAFILAFITSLNDVSVSLFLTGPGVSTLQVEVLTYVEQYFDPSVAAVSVLLMAITLVVMVVLERSFGLSNVVK